MLGSPNGVVVDSAGNLYIADAYNARIRKVDPAGIITTIAGNGSSGFGGDGGPATAAVLNSPSGVVVDGVGNLYIADSGNNRIRKVNPAGIITTVAGNGSSKYSGDGGPAIAAGLQPSGLVVDSVGGLYIADSGNYRIRKVDLAGIITTVAGSGSYGYSGDGGPAKAAAFIELSGVAVDSIGNLYIADTDGANSRGRIRKVNSAGIITTVVGNGTSGDGGPAAAAALRRASGVAVDNLGNLYIADNYDGRIRKVDSAGTITTVAGDGTSGYSGDNGSATAAALNFPMGIAVGSVGDLYIADTSNGRVRKVGLAGIITTVAGVGSSNFSGDGGPAMAAALPEPSGVAVDSASNLYIADRSNNRIRKVDPAGIITTVAGNRTPGYSGDGGPATAAKLLNPWSVAVDSLGNLYIADSDNHRIRKVDSAGIITTVAGNGTSGYSGDGKPATAAALGFPSSIVVDNTGNLYIADKQITDRIKPRIRKVDTAGIITTMAGNGTKGYSGDGGLATKAALGDIWGMAVDSFGYLYIADASNSRVRRVDPAGIITTVAGNGTDGYSGDDGPATAAALQPFDVAVDGVGNLFITGNNRIRKVDTAGIITTVAGNGAYNFSGDGGPATAAAFRGPSGIAMDSIGNLYIADTYNNRVRKVDYFVSSIAVPNLSQPAAFGNQPVGTPSPAQVITLSNTGTAAYGISAITATGDFTVTHNCGTSLAAGANCTLQITFTPATTGNRTGTLTVTGTGTSGNPLTANLSGTGTPAPTPTAVLSQPTPFPNQTINTTSPPQAITLTNTGTAPLVLRSGAFKLPAAFAANGDFAVASDTCGDSLAAGGACTVNVTFTPTALGLRTGQLIVGGAAGNTPAGTVSLSGTGVNPPSTLTADLALKLTAPKTAKKGKSLVYSLTVSNKSKSNAPNVLLKGTLDSGAAYSKLPAFCGATGQSLTCQLGTLNGKKQKTFTVTITVKSSAAGTLSFNASLSGDINDPNSANNAAAVSTKVK